MSPKWNRPGMLSDTFIRDFAMLTPPMLIYCTVPESLPALSGGVNMSFIRLIALTVLAQIPFALNRCIPSLLC